LCSPRLPPCCIHKSGQARSPASNSSSRRGVCSPRLPHCCVHKSGQATSPASSSSSRTSSESSAAMGREKNHISGAVGWRTGPEFQIWSSSSNLRCVGEGFTTWNGSTNRQRWRPWRPVAAYVLQGGGKLRRVAAARGPVGGT
jgi:hypothetical protein